jgi:hypothetical protein
MGPAAQQAVEAAALVVVLDLAGVAGAHGADPVGVVQPGLHEVEAAVELDAVHREVMGGQAQLAEVGGVEDALVGQVVDGEQAGREACPRRSASARR